jgi:hypothetical protein
MASPKGRVQSVEFYDPIFFRGACASVTLDFKRPTTSELGLLFRLRLNRNKKHWDRSNHGDHGASRGKAITMVIPVFPALPVVEPMYQCCLVVRPAKADAFSGRQSHQGKSQTPCSLDGREERNQ